MDRTNRDEWKWAKLVQALSTARILAKHLTPLRRLTF